MRGGNGEIAFEETNGDVGDNDVPSLAKSVKEQGPHSVELLASLGIENVYWNFGVNLF